MDLTQKVLDDAGPSGARVDPGTDVYALEDLIWPYPYGNAISNNAAGPPIRIFGGGHRMINLPGGGPSNETMAEGICIIGCSVSVDNFNIGIGPELGKFRVGIRLPAYQDALGNPYYDSVPGNHFLQDLIVSGWFMGIQTMGYNCEYIKVCVQDTGGGGLQARPIGIDHFGPGARINDCYVHNMVKGSEDLETMHMHLEDADGGTIGTLTLADDVRHPSSYGIWFNTATGRFDADAMTIQNIEYPLAGDLAAGTFTGSASNFIKKSTLPKGPVIHLSNG